MIDTRKLVEWLGSEGARAGLRESDLSVSDLIDLAKSRGLPLAPKPTRDEIANELAYENSTKIDKKSDDLIHMSQTELIEYLEIKRPTLKEMLSILTDLGIRPSSEDRKHLLRFAAREISEIGMFQRVARGAAATGSRRS
ncbi:MAG TPA: hypothetical protein VMF86_05800 [Stellaceae bacterium]|nr:hypothetical protein [Stellaceae bacterium]